MTNNIELNTLFPNDLSTIAGKQAGAGFRCKDLSKLICHLRRHFLLVIFNDVLHRYGDGSGSH